VTRERDGAKARDAKPSAKPQRKAESAEGLDGQAKRTSPKTIEARLLEILRPILAEAGGFVATLEDVGDEGVYGLAITLRNHRSFDLVIRECRK
jgi:hypothetical protein